jgi:hypothetical protein
LGNLAKCEITQDRSHSLQFSETVDDRITEWPRSWPHGEISYRLNNHTDDIAKERWQTRSVVVALRAWQLRLSHLKFRRERNPDTHVDFNVSFEDLAHFDGKRGVLAHAYFPGQGDLSGDCHINDDWNWVARYQDQTMGKPPLLPILIHEFGHSLGLRHDPFDKTDIMYPSFDLGGPPKYKIGSRSIERAQERYGKRNLPSFILAYFQRRRLESRDFR